MRCFIKSFEQFSLELGNLNSFESISNNIDALNPFKEITNLIFNFGCFFELYLTYEIYKNNEEGYTIQK